MPRMLNNKEWDQFNQLLIEIADMGLPSWKDKKATLLLNLSESGKAALQEILTWDLDDD